MVDVVQDGVSGYLSKGTTPREIADAINLFLENPISKESVFSYAKKLSWENYLEGLFAGRGGLIS